MKRGPDGGVICGLLALVYSVDICQGKIITFSVSRVRDDGCSFIHNDVALACDVDDDYSTIAIRRLKDGSIVNMSRIGGKSLTYNIYAVSCSDMGTYECLLDSTERLTVDVVIADCPLQSCDGAAVNRTMFIDVGDPVRFSVCVLACYYIDSNAAFNGSLVRRRSHSVWTWDYEPITSTGMPTNRFHVHVRRDRMDNTAFGLLHVRIFSYLGELYYWDCHIMLQPPGPPQCPTDITVTNYAHDFVILSWKPGLDGGSRQYFYVYYSKDTVTWYTHESNTGNTTETVSGLSSNTNYYFRLASWNRHSPSVDASTCTRAVFVTTKRLINHVGLYPVPERSNIGVLAVGVCLILVGMLFLSALFCWRRQVNREHTRRDTIQGQVEIPMVETLSGSNTSPGEYATIDDLK